MKQSTSTITILSDHISPSLIGNLQAKIRDHFELPVKIEEYLPLDFNFAFNRKRNQYQIDKIFVKMKSQTRATEIQLLVVDFDLYVPHLNFVFGEASPQKSLAAVSITRLKTEFYGEKRNDDLFRQRVAKEAIHELGHLFRLGHCSNKTCVMHFSNSLADTDYKSTSFCQNCLDVKKKNSRED